MYNAWWPRLTLMLDTKESSVAVEVVGGPMTDVCSSCMRLRSARTSSWYCCHWCWMWRSSSLRLTACLSSMATRWLRLVSDSWIRLWLCPVDWDSRSWAWLLRVAISLCRDRSSRWRAWAWQVLWFVRLSKCCKIDKKAKLYYWNKIHLPAMIKILSKGWTKEWCKHTLSPVKLIFTLRSVAHRNTHHYIVNHILSV